MAASGRCCENVEFIVPRKASPEISDLKSVVKVVDLVYSKMDVFHRPFFKEIENSYFRRHLKVTTLGQQFKESNENSLISRVPITVIDSSARIKVDPWLVIFRGSSLKSALKNGHSFRKATGRVCTHHVVI